jgi:hypothetical protein
MLGAGLTSAAQHPEIERRKRGRAGGSEATAKQPATTKFEDRAPFAAQGGFGYFIRLSLARKSMKVRTLAERYLRLG